MHKKINAALLLVSLVLPLFLFTYTAYNSRGFDDEYFNINHVESYSSVHDLINAHFSGKFVDIHPVGSYLINYVLLKLLGSWRLVRTAGAVVSCLSIWLFWYFIAAEGKDNLTAFFAYIFMCLNPTLLLWCTSVRWYTYFFPLICVMGMLFCPPDFLNKRKYLFWGIYFLTASMLFYIESNAAIMIIVSFILILFQRRKSFREEYKVILCLGLLSLLAVSKQIYMFLTVLYPSVKDSGEFYSLMRSIAGGGQNFLCGHAVMPVSAAGIILIIANGLLFLAFIVHFRVAASSYANKFFMLSYAGIIFSGIGGKIRNYVSLSAVHGNFLADTFSSMKSRKIKLTVLALYIIGTAWGIHNVVFHTDTTRGTWNTPYDELIEFLEDCASKESCVVVSHNPVFSYHARREGFTVIDAEANSDWYEKLSAHDGSVIVLRTYKGSMPDEEFRKFNSYIDSRHIVLAKSFGYDKFAAFKRRFDKDYPDYYAELIVTE